MAYLIGKSGGDNSMPIKRIFSVNKICKVNRVGIEIIRARLKLDCLNSRYDADPGRWEAKAFAKQVR